MKNESDTPKNDLKERSFEFAKRIIFLCQKLEQSPGVTKTISNQLLRSGTSIGANIEEAHGSRLSQILPPKCIFHVKKPERRIIGFVC